MLVASTDNGRRTRLASKQFGSACSAWTSRRFAASARLGDSGANNGQ
jgi:hypothetical protein